MVGNDATKFLKKDDGQKKDLEHSNQSFKVKVCI
jgi:hypothetical protein